MPQKEYILRVAEVVGRALAQIIYHQDMRDYQGALSLIDEVFNLNREERMRRKHISS